MSDIYSSDKIFQSYFDRAPEKRWIVEAFKNKLRFGCDTASILDVGCHNGNLMRRLVKTYYDDLPGCTRIIGVDPCMRAISLFNQIYFGDKVTAHGYAVTIEKYFENNNHDYDWIIASQSLYWTKNLKKIIQQITQGSRNTLIVLRGKTGIYQIQHAFPELVGNKMEMYYHAEHIQDALMSLKIPFARENKTTHITLPDCHSPVYRYLLDFFLQTSINKLAQTDIDRVNHFIALEFASVLRHDVSAFWIRRE